ncbi:Protein of unknown function [Sphingomonas gellani]|uniref:DUF2975 domain-containing protein n=1 Tax=Sphingomonas gellani TaxID=1166340 RepID=A0A1H8G824_9SPHN|nr:DUF2975 domain-containing protein [Sphingomonas gellani]SEN39667.1 Protein of unknown function [Sphingomonas gellani]
MKDHHSLTAARWLLRGVFWLNISSAIGFAAFMLFSVFGHAMLADHLARKYAGRLDVDTLIVAMRLLFVIGLAAVAVAWVIITRLLAMIATVTAGDPFVTPNARRLHEIGWALVGWQLLDLAGGVIITWIGRMGADVTGWTPSLAGWVVTLLVFVLARVFAAGTTMRDDLQGTV